MTHLIQGNRVYIKVPYDQKEVIKQIPGWRWNPKQKLWSIPYDEDTVVLANSLLGISLPQPVISRIEDSDRIPATDLVLKNLYKHQKESVQVARKTKYFADLSEPGTGKTLVQIELMLERNDWPVLVICPKSIMEPVWEKQLDECKLTGIILNEGSAKVKKVLNTTMDCWADNECHEIFWNQRIYIINYEMVPRVLDELMQIKWKAIILDESTRIKSPNAQRSKAIMKLRDMVSYRSIMTGTLAPNGLQDAFNQYKFVQPNIFGEVFYAFRHRYFTQGGYLNYEWFPKPEALDVFKRKAAGVSIQHHKRECIDLPPLVEEIRKVEMLSKQKEVYEQMKNECIVWLNENNAVTAPFVITKLMKLRQIASGFIYMNEKSFPISNSNPKDAAMFEILDQIGDKKCIVFAHFNRTIEHIREKLNGKSIAYFGSEKSVALEVFEHKKTNPRACQILIANPASAGHGLNLQFCSNIIYYEQDFNLENYIQSMQRIERIGQKNKMTVYHLLTKGTVENYIYKKLKQKEDVNRKLDINELKGAL